MKDFYKKRIMCLSANIADREALASDQMISGSGARATEYMSQADKMRKERANYEEALGRIE
jgi:hypothetical protein